MIGEKIQRFHPKRKLVRMLQKFPHTDVLRDPCICSLCCGIPEYTSASHTDVRVLAAPPLIQLLLSHREIDNLSDATTRVYLKVAMLSEFNQMQRDNRHRVFFKHGV